MRARNIAFLCLLALLAACAAPGPATGVPAAPAATPTPPLATPSATLPPPSVTPSPTEPPPTATPTVLSARATAAPSLSSAVLLHEWNATLGRYETRPVDPLTGQAIPGYAPVVTGEGRTFLPPQALSANGRKLAIAVAKGQSCEGYAGGTSCRASADLLRLIDLPTWREVTVPLPANGWVRPIAFDPAAAHLALAYLAPSSTTLMRFDANTGQLAAQRQISFRPTLLEFTPDGATLVLYGQPLSDNPGVTKPDSPRLLLLDAATLAPRWDQELAGLTSGRWCETECFSWIPAAVLSPDRARLYLVHADAERLTTADLVGHTIQTTEIQAAQSRADRLVALTAASAAAKEPEIGASKSAVISPDGKRLYVVGSKRQATTATPTPGPAAVPLGLQVIDVASGRKVASRDSEAISIAITPDGAHLLLVGWGLGRTDLLDAASFERVARLEGWEVLAGRRLDGQPLILARQQNQQTPRLAVLDPRSFAITHSWSPDNYATWVTGP